MIKRVLIIITAVFILFTTKVNASSITYNLNINKDMKLSETIYYSVEKEKVNAKYDSFLKSIVLDNVYFDTNKSVKYQKTREKNNIGYSVILRHQHSSIFLNNERIIKECFNKISYNSDPGSLTFKNSEGFNCSHRADKITINITTPLNVISNNADIVKSNTYTWNNINNNFVLDFKVAKEKIEKDPMDKPESSENNNNNKNNSSNTEESKAKEKKR